jgi:hypothetical protein
VTPYRRVFFIIIVLYRAILSLEAPNYFYKNNVIEIMTWKLNTHTGNDAKQDLLIIDAENGLLSHPSTLIDLLTTVSERISLY